jgi:hypothetical protein
MHVGRNKVAQSAAELRKRVARRLRHVVAFDFASRPKFRRESRLIGPAYHCR